MPFILPIRAQYPCGACQRLLFADISVRCQCGIGNTTGQGFGCAIHALWFLLLVALVDPQQEKPHSSSRNNAGTAEPFRVSPPEAVAYLQHPRPYCCRTALPKRFDCHTNCNKADRPKYYWPRGTTELKPQCSECYQPRVYSNMDTIKIAAITANGSPTIAAKWAFASSIIQRSVLIQTERR
jgi:hypothetical protein